jgi:putative sterol carrier protein
VSGAAASGTVHLLVKKGKRAERAVVLHLAEGEVAGVDTLDADAANALVDDDADLVLSLTPDDAGAIAAGTLDPSVAFMRGTMKTAGDPGLVLWLLPIASGDAFAPVRAALT